jgi:hypothetical protein
MFSWLKICAGQGWPSRKHPQFGGIGGLLETAQDGEDANGSPEICEPDTSPTVR